MYYSWFPPNHYFILLCPSNALVMFRVRTSAKEKLHVQAVWKIASHLYPISVMVEQQYSRTCHFLGFHHCLEVCQQTHVFRHICCQNLGRELIWMHHSAKGRVGEQSSRRRWWRAVGQMTVNTGWWRVDNTHHVNYKFSQALSLPLAEVLKDVTVVLVEKFEAHG